MATTTTTESDSEGMEMESMDIKPELGYCLTLDEATDKVNQHEEDTDTNYGLLRSDLHFGSTNWNKEDCRIQWEEVDKYHGERLDFDGVPFIVLGSKYLGCQHGVRNTVKNSKYAEWRKKEGEEPLARKGSCPARIILKEVIKFPNYKIDSNTNYEKKKWSKVVRDDIRKETAGPQRRIYVQFPSSQDHQHIKIVKTQSVIRHCLICNGKLSASVRSAVPLFSSETRTSHRHLEAVALLNNILGLEVEEEAAHSRIVCTRCFNLIDEIDSLEEQLDNKKQIVVNRYKRTMAEVTQSGSSLDGLELEDYHVSDSMSVARKRGRPRGRGRGPGRPRGSRTGRGRGSGRSAIDSTSIVKVEMESSPSPEEPSQEGEAHDDHTIFKAIKTPTILKTIKKEDIMSDIEGPQEAQHKVLRIEAMGASSSMTEEEEEVTATIIPIVDDSGIAEAQVLEVVESVLEEEEKQEKLYGCSQCDKQFMTKSAIRNHIKIHDRFDANYDCEECEKSFSNKHSLKAHLKTHVDRDRPHICRVCGKSFYTRYHLNSHLKSHEGGRNFVCDQCGKALSTQKTLELHALTHTDKKPYECKLCGMGFMRKPMCVSHLAAHGETENPEGHIIFNSPSALVSAGESLMVTEEEEVEHAVHTVRMATESDGGEEVEEQTTQLIRDGKVVKVMSRPAVHFIDADDTTRYVIQTGERLREENMEQFFAGIAVEVRTEDF
ncbi:hypothetical protein Pcinc_013891 [Petrolisthes cinctipes]|uniref:Uncharacterized protein n=1 Tax=Petrolisthes cinctipes TaxID=88211 RepID=A0AAE1FY30_PETCI|nr:hypothetical protein Pcinc_013891 [Petrolisthes cinctipes]